MGIAKAVTMAVSNSNKYTFIEGGEIESFRKRIEARKRSLGKQMKYASDNRRGHGTNTLIKPLEKLSSKISDFRNTTNHRYSKYIIDYAKKNNCTVIQMEKLTNINRTSKFLMSWTYHDLQSKISYKAKESGIEVILIDPKYTSQRCNTCGWIDKRNRQTQDAFDCINCGYKTNADVNAAKNISILGIENIINDQIIRVE